MRNVGRDSALFSLGGDLQLYSYVAGGVAFWLADRVWCYGTHIARLRLRLCSRLHLRLH